MVASRQIARSALQAARTTSRRSYATADRPPLAHGGNNRNIIIGLTTVSVTAAGYFLVREKDPGSDNVTANKSGAIVNNFDAIQPPQLNAKPPKTREERQREGQHPEDLDPKYRAEFGRQHARKRVDEPPSNRNHQALSDKSKENAKV